jgi:hypothetical protein
MLLLERLGYEEVKATKRGAQGDVFFSAVLRRGLSEQRVCVQLTGQRSPLPRSVVTELRGTLHHHNAVEGVILHLGEVSDEALAESREPRLAPVAIYDRAQVLSAMCTHELGIRRAWVPVTLLDVALLDGLRGGSQEPK